MQFMAIGEFAERTRLSAKALRLYHELKLVVPARVDPSSGYRHYGEDQVETARLVGYLRRAGLPLALISTVVTMDGPDAARAVADWWGQVETRVIERRALVSYLPPRTTSALVPDLRTH
jgi:DNA-binding transcriptional MerR regulator